MQDTGPQSSSASEPFAPKNLLPALPLPFPCPDYVACPHCGEPELEIWCYEEAVQCYNCGGSIRNKAEVSCRNAAACLPKLVEGRPCGCG